MAVVEPTGGGGIGPGRRSRLGILAPFTTFAILVTASAGLVLLFFVFDPLGGGSRSANDVLAAAIDAADHPERVGLRSVHGVAEIEPSRPTISDRLDDQGIEDDPSIVKAEIPADPSPEVTYGPIRIWFEASDRYRVESMIKRGDSAPELSRMILTDGLSTWEYVPTSNKYTSAPPDPAQSTDDLRLSLALGGNAENIQELLAKNDQQNGRRAVLAGEDRPLGRDVYVIEISPAWEGSGGNDVGTSAVESGRVARLWLDKEFLFALRWEVTSESGETYGVRYSAIEFNSDIDDALFHFTPPPGAVEVSREEMLRGGSTGGSSSRSGKLGAQVSLPAGFLAPTEFLPGYQARSVSVSHHNDVTYEAAFLIREDDGRGYVSAQERRGRGDLPEALMQGDRVPIRGTEAWLRADDELLHLAWQEGALVVYVIARGVDQDELLRVVESMQVSGGSCPEPAPSGCSGFPEIPQLSEPDAP